jgi:hypothetical protein
VERAKNSTHKNQGKGAKKILIGESTRKNWRVHRGYWRAASGNNSHRPVKKQLGNIYDGLLQNFKSPLKIKRSSNFLKVYCHMSPPTPIQPYNCNADLNR